MVFIFILYFRFQFTNLLFFCIDKAAKLGCFVGSGYNKTDEATVVGRAAPKRTLRSPSDSDNFHYQTQMKTVWSELTKNDNRRGTITDFLVLSSGDFDHGFGSWMFHSDLWLERWYISVFTQNELFISSAGRPKISLKYYRHLVTM